MRTSLAAGIAALLIAGDAAAVQVIDGAAPPRRERIAAAPRDGVVTRAPDWLVLIAGLAGIGLATRRRRAPRAVTD